MVGSWLNSLMPAQDVIQDVIQDGIQDVMSVSSPTDNLTGPALALHTIRALNRVCQTIITYPDQENFQLSSRSVKSLKQKLKLFSRNLKAGLDATVSKFSRVDFSVHPRVWQNPELALDMVKTLHQRAPKLRIKFNVNPFLAESHFLTALANREANKSHGFLNLPYLAHQLIMSYIIGYDLRPYFMICHEGLKILQRSAALSHIDLLREAELVLPQLLINKINLAHGHPMEVMRLHQLMCRDFFIPDDQVRGITLKRLQYLLHIFETFDLFPRLNPFYEPRLRGAHEASPDLIKVLGFNIAHFEREKLEKYHKAQVNLSEKLAAKVKSASADDDDNDNAQIDPDDHSISGEAIMTLPPRAPVGFKLDRLTISHSNITHLPDWVWGLTDLTSLSLNQNRLRFISPKVGNLTKLGLLWLHNNKLTSLPPQFAQLTRLQTIYVGDNALISLPDDLTRMRDLMGIYACNNRLEELPSTLPQLPELQSLEVIGNRLTKLPAGLTQLRRLELVFLEANNFTPEARQEIDAWYKALKAIPNRDRGYVHRAYTI